MAAANGNGKYHLISKHLILVIILVVALLITEGLVFWAFKNSTDLMDILALTFGTFGAWIGAGAAYFFGRENMITATQSLLKMSGKTPEEILAATTLQDMKPRPIQTFNINTPLEKVIKWIKTEAEKYVFAVVDKENKFERALSDEAVYRYVYDQAKKKPDVPFVITEEDLNKQTLESLIDHYKKEKSKEVRALIEFAVELSQDMTSAEANKKIEKGNRYIGVILDEQRQPIGYITTNDIRRLMLGKSETN